MLKDGQSGATEDKESLLLVGQSTVLPLAKSGLLDLGVVVVPNLASGEVEIDFLLLKLTEEERGSDHLRSK